MIHQTYFLTFTETAITRRWLLSDGQWVETNGFQRPATTPGMGKVYIFACAQTQWPFYVGQTRGSVASRFRGAFKCTPEKRTNGFAGYRFKRELTSAFLHVFLGDASAPWTSQDAECIEAEVVFRIRHESGKWPAFQSEIHFAPPTAQHSAAADEIIAHFKQLAKEPLPLLLGREGLPSSTYIAPSLEMGIANVENIGI